jgi:tetratricopeptide (TPR) repeat protein
MGLFIGIGAVVLVAGGVGGYFALRPKPPEKIVDATPTAAPPTVAPTAAAPTAVPTAIVTEPPPTPTIDPHAKAASTLRAAQAALAKGDYAHALEQANAALREDPASAQAKEIANRAVAGQQAEGHFRAAEAALQHGKWDDARKAAEAGRALAPGDPHGSNLLIRINEEQQKAEAREADAQAARAAQEARDRAAEAKKKVSTLVARAAGEFGAGQYDATIATCKEIIALDPSNETAQKLMVEATIKKAGPGPGPATAAHRFVVQKTTKQSAETKSGTVPEGFEETAGVTARRASAVTDMPGEIDFDVNPPSPSPGDKYVVRVIFRNDGNAPISIKGLTVTTTINTKKVGPFPVPVNVKDVAPHQKAVLLETPDFWKDDITVWVMEATVATTRNETYTNRVIWR